MIKVKAIDRSIIHSVCEGCGIKQDSYWYISIGVFCETILCSFCKGGLANILSNVGTKQRLSLSDAVKAGFSKTYERRRTNATPAGKIKESDSS